MYATGENLMAEQNDILVVEDSSSMSQLLVEMLAAEGYKVRVANSGELALTSIMKHLPDLVLLDVQMPGIDGFKVCRWLKGDATLKSIPVIFISAASNVKDIVTGFHAGGVDYITKPFQVEEVLARVKTQLELKRQKELLEQRTVELEAALSKVRVLSGIIPICASCKKIRDDRGYWNQVEMYLRDHSDAMFSHGACPECVQNLYGCIDDLPSFGEA